MKNDIETLSAHWLEYTDTGSFIPLLVFLEHPLAEAREIVSSLNLEDFPYRRLTEFAVSSEADYWARLAVDWLEQGLDINEKVANAITLMVKEKRTSQKTRERAFQLLKNFEKSDAV